MMPIILKKKGLEHPSRMRRCSKKTISELNNIQPFNFEDGVYKCAVTISSIPHGVKWWYISCKTCKKKVEQQVDHTYKCPNGHNSGIVPRYILSFSKSFREYVVKSVLEKGPPRRPLPRAADSDRAGVQIAGAGSSTLVIDQSSSSHLEDLEPHGSAMGIDNVTQQPNPTCLSPLYSRLQHLQFTQEAASQKIMLTGHRSRLAKTCFKTSILQTRVSLQLETQRQASQKRKGLPLSGRVLKRAPVNQPP